MLTLAAGAALLPGGWARDVVFGIGDDGMIASVEPNADTTGMERTAGPVVPAMPNLHSHAFQRALAGRTGRTSLSHDDSFWTWRQAMYAFLDRVDADAFEAIAAQAYVEMAKAGYASVAEFHYVHHDPAGKPYADSAELAWRIVAAARVAGIGLTLLPVFYAHAGFGGTPTTAAQRRFVHTTYTFTHLYERLRRESPRTVTCWAWRRTACARLRRRRWDTWSALPRRTPRCTSMRPSRPRKSTIASRGAALRPVEWLLTQASVDARWCIVHATHMTEKEVAALAASGAVAGLAPTTEADLGDGTFPGQAYLAAGGRFGVGSDSNTIVDPFAECGNSSGRSGCGRAGAMCWDRVASSRSEPHSGQARRAAARRRWGNRSARSQPAFAPTWWC